VRVGFVDVQDDAGNALAETLARQGHPQPLYQHCDVCDVAALQDAIAVTGERLGPVTVLVNNAGVLMFAELATMELADFDRLVGINMRGCFLGMKTVSPGMVEAGGGSIVNCSSIEGLGGMPTLVAYTGTKFAIRGMTKAAAMELGSKGVRVNSVHPGMIDTGMIRGYTGEEGLVWGAKKVPLKRVGTPDDVAPMYVFFASDESGYCTGAEFVADGGVTATHAFGG